ncbi:hypothetical protein D7V86_20250 [bacterium D16-51]|nr:hypothetical protein D7V96_20360 [bacterium D16-59]RKI56186.1 hypothetical protein D7V86_20250 [bacterium D16-51]
MEEERKLLVGIDLGWETTQMTCFDFVSYEPVPIGRKIQGQRVYEIPTGLAVNPANGEWYWIDEEYAKQDGVICLHHLLADVLRDEKITAGRYSIESYQALKRFIVKLLSLLKEYYPADMIRRLVITVAERRERFREYLTAICGELGIPKGSLVIQNHRQSYMYYAVSQPKELWAHNVGLFEMENNMLLYSQIDIDKKTVPYIVGVIQKDLSDGIDWAALEKEGASHISYAFLNAANTALHKQLVTTVYVTGKGFEGPWADEALKELCVGRRVFRGQNLFTKGACYAARELAGEGKLGQCLFLDEDMIACNVLLRVYHDASVQDVMLAKAGALWSEVDSSIDVIPDEEEEIRITIQDVLKHETRAHMLSLSGFAGRENKMTRFTIRIRFAASNTCIVTLKDNGFGEYCPSSNRVWERYITV